MTTVIDHTDRGHSPLGASGAERWGNCPGSVALIRELQLPESDEPDYRREGTAMHEAAEHCLRTGCDTWEIVGQTFNETVITDALAEAIQVYLDVCRADMDTAAYHYIELGLAAPELHELAFGTLDFGAIFGAPSFEEPHFIVPTLVKVRDLKGGEGIVVDPEENPQLMYYALLLILQNPHWSDDTPVELEIAQPRAFHVDGPIRTWTTTVGAIREWMHSWLIPAMARTEIDDELDAGPWCRFCPAKLVCPKLTALFKAAAISNPQEIVAWNDATLGQNYKLVAAVEFYTRALKEETLRRALKGRTFEGAAKLVKKKSNRVWKGEAEAKVKALFGDKAYTKPELKSPPEIEKLGPDGKEFVKEYAYSPDTGLTLARWDDPKVGIKVESSEEAFADAAAALGYTEDAA